jgi:outer membrane protein OmpA-like peptidoglycan-associated protein
MSSPLKTIDVNRVTVEAKKSGNIADTNYEYYSLILFDFNSTNLGDRNDNVIDYIKTRIKPDSKTIISGYTDIIGLAEANKKLATERASISAKRLGIENVELRGIGTDELLYDNKYPEGRFYCRTVTIHIATPITND